MARIQRHRLLPGIIAAMLWGIGMTTLPAPSGAKIVSFAVAVGFFASLIMRSWWALLLVPFGLIAGVALNTLLPGAGNAITGIGLLLGLLSATLSTLVTTAVEQWLRARRKLKG